MFENLTQADVENLQKAMQAGLITGQQTVGLKGTFEPLKLESLDPMMANLEFREKDVRLWYKMPKTDANQTVEEAVQLVSYGADRGGFVGEGGRPDFEDSTYTRITQQVKTIAIGSEVTWLAQLSKTMLSQSAYATEIQNKMQWVLRRTNTLLTSADASINDKEFNGIYKQHAVIAPGVVGAYADFHSYFTDKTVIDMRGKTLTQYELEDAATVLDANYANVSDLFAAPGVITGVTKDYFNDQRLLISTPQTGYVGNPIKLVGTTFGDIAMNPDKMMGIIKQARTSGDGATSPNAPSAPVADPTTPVALRADQFARFTSGEATGGVFYGVAAVNYAGESNITVLNSTKVAITVGSSVDLKFTPGVGSAYPATGYRIYRSEVTTATSSTGVRFYPLFKVSPADLSTGYNGGAAGIISDRGYFMANVEQAFVTEMIEDVMSWKQLAPMSKMELARTGLSSPFVVAHAGTVFVKAPKKIVRFVNVGVNYTRPA